MSVVSCRLRLWASTIERLLKQRTLIGTTESVCVRTGFISLRWEKTAEIALIQPRSGGMKLARGVTPGSVGKSRSRGRGVRVLTQTLTPCPDTKQIKAEFPALYWAAMWSRPLFSAFVWLTLLLPLTATAQAPSGDKTPQTTNSATGIPTFYANSRQVIVEAEVWDKTRKNGDDSGIDPALPPAERAALRLVPPPTQGLPAKDVHVFDNGVEQKVNYFKETDFPAGDITGQWTFDSTTGGTWRRPPPPGLALATWSASYLIDGREPDRVATS